MSKLSACIALLVCLSSPAPARAQAEPATRPPLLVGVHGGFDFGEGDIHDERFGVQGSIPLVWRLTVDPVFSYLYNFPDDPTGVFGGSAWETYFTLRVHPFGYDSFLSLGYGFTVVHASLHTKDHTFSDSNTDGTDVGVIGLTYPKGESVPSPRCTSWICSSVRAPSAGIYCSGSICGFTKGGEDGKDGDRAEVPSAPLRPLRPSSLPPASCCPVRLPVAQLPVGFLPQQ